MNTKSYELTISEFFLLTILSLLVFAFAIAMDLYLPFLPSMKLSFHANQVQIQLTMSLFILFFGLAQLALGPFLNIIGRKNTALLGTLIYIMGSLFITFSNSISILITLRIIQCFGSAAMLVSAYAMARNEFNINKSGKIFSYLTAAISLSPLLGPVIGSYLKIYFDWKSCFYLLSIIGIITFILTLCCVQESHFSILTKKQWFKFYEKYLSIIMNKKFVKYSISSGIGFSSFFSFFSSSIYLITEYFKVPLKYFGYCFGTISFIFLIGNILSGKVIFKLGASLLSTIGGYLIFFGGITMLLSIHARLVIFLTSISIVCIGASSVIGSGASEALNIFNEDSNAASALLGCLQFSTASIVGTLVMLFPAKSIYPLSLTTIILGMIVILFHSNLMNYIHEIQSIVRKT